MILLNGVEVNVTKFPDGTSQVWKLEENLLNLNYYMVEWKFQDEGEFMHLAQLVDLLREYNSRAEILLQLDYLPYARQDHPITNETTFSLYTFSKLLNSLNFFRVTIVDAHSSAYQLINNSINIDNNVEFHRFCDGNDIDVVVYPDKGAIKKYTGSTDLPELFGDKTRDPLTGYLQYNDIKGDTELIRGKNVIIRDDLCDGGMTFILLAKKLLQYEPKSVNLYVSHGIFSKGMKPLRDAGIDKIYFVTDQRRK